MIWVVSGTSKSIVPKEKVELSLDWPTQCLLIAAKYHLKNGNKQYCIRPELYAKVYEFESKCTKQYENQWNVFLKLLSKGDEAAAVLLLQTKSTLSARVNNATAQDH